MKMNFNKQDFKEKLIVSSVTTGIFLPVRLLFYTLVSQYWVGSFGVVSIMAIVLLILIKKKKLGRYGFYFEKQVTRMINNRWGKMYFGMLFFSLFVFTTTITFIDLGDNYYKHDRDLFYSLISLGVNNFYDELPKMHIKQPSLDVLHQAQSMTKQDKIDFLQKYEHDPKFMGALILNTMNQIYSGWVAHFAVVGMVSSIEMIFLFITYKRLFKPQLETDH